jgi:aryl-alcohol dehydrogenase-like predicted oxidoreductase
MKQKSGSKKPKAKLRGWSRFVGLQIEYSLIQRTVERELVPMAKALQHYCLTSVPLTTVGTVQRSGRKP